MYRLDRRTRLMLSVVGYPMIMPWEIGSVDCGGDVFARRTLPHIRQTWSECPQPFTGQIISEERDGKDDWVEISSELGRQIREFTRI